MPDVWTHHPEMLRDFLIQAGLRCGAEPRVLKPRDPEWTCHVDGPGWIGDIYIHHAAAPVSESPFFNYYYAVMLCIFVLGYVVGKVMQRRGNRSSQVFSP